jgi:hypothetical protein
MPSTSPIPLTSVTGQELAYASEAASKYAATVIAFVIEFTRGGSDDGIFDVRVQPKTGRITRNLKLETFFKPDTRAA